MKVIVNALSVTNLSGRHVLLGHFSYIATQTKGRHEYIFLYHPGNRNLCRDLGENVSWVECPSTTRHWAGRTVWERLFLNRLVSKLEGDVLFSPAGVVTSSVSIPQIAFAQNPWCLVDSVPKGLSGQFKAILQRNAYRTAMKAAHTMVFNSCYLKKAYELNAGCNARSSVVINQAIDDMTHDAGEKKRGDVRRKPYQVVCVSVMAPHKGVEVVVEAVGILQSKHSLPVELKLVGPWPDPGYRKTIERLISRLDLENHVHIKGYVEVETLWDLYAESKVFCLMSTCESFGIPSVEAQVFGTPVVSSNCCAIPEICGNGGIFPEPNDAWGCAGALLQLILDEDTWKKYSENAVSNAARYRWEFCSRPFVKLFDALDKNA